MILSFNKRGSLRSQKNLLKILCQLQLSPYFKGGLVFDVVKVKSNDTTTPWIGIYQSIRGKGKALVPKNTSLVPCGHSWGIFGTRALPVATHALVNSNPGGGNITVSKKIPRIFSIFIKVIFSFA